jgi:integrase
MAGSVWERKDGRFGAKLPYPVPGGGTKIATTTKSTREAAEKWLARMREDAADAEPIVTGSLSVARYLDEWLRDAVEPFTSRRTYEKRAWAVNLHIQPALGSVRLRDLDARRIQTLYASMAREGYSYSTRREIHVTLKMALGQALKWGLVRRNECEIADAQRDLGPPAEEEVRHLTDEQARLFFRATAESRWGNYYVAAVRTGLRPGELLGLRWEDLVLDSDPGSLRVRRTLDAYREAVFNPPKTARSRRAVALHYEAREAFLSQRAMLKREGLPTGRKALVFPSSTGTPMKADNLRKRNLKPDLARAGLPELTLHELRHTFASTMLHEWHVPPAVVSEAMGHADIAFTFRIYGHLIESAQADVMRHLNAEQRRSEAG